MILKAKWGNWYFEKFSCKKWIFPVFLLLKTGKLSNFTLDNFFCSVKFRQDSPIFPNSTVLEHSKLIISSGILVAPLCAKLLGQG
jgi:hypothetical protein